MPPKPSMSLRRPPDPTEIERFVAGAAQVPALLRAEIERRLEAFCTARGLDRTRVIETAVERHLDAELRPSAIDRVRAIVGIVRGVIATARRTAARA